MLFIYRLSHERVELYSTLRRAQRRSVELRRACARPHPHVELHAAAEGSSGRDAEKVHHRRRHCRRQQSDDRVKRHERNPDRDHKQGGRHGTGMFLLHKFLVASSSCAYMFMIS